MEKKRFVGIDISKKTLDVVIYSGGGIVVVYVVICRRALYLSPCFPTVRGCPVSSCNLRITHIKITRRIFSRRQRRDGQEQKQDK